MSPGHASGGEPFDITLPLPEGTTVLEASAGTGKTWTIAAIATKLVAEGTTLDRLLLVTFGVAASGELRERIRDRLNSVLRGLDARAAGLETGDDDPLIPLLATCTDDELALRRRRITRALADFDAATITTIHSFCQEILGGLGIIGDVDRGFALSEDLSELRGQVSDDLYAWRFCGEAIRREKDPPQLTPAAARTVAKEAIDNPDVELADPDGKQSELHNRLATKAREVFTERKRALGVLGFDDLLEQLVTSLRGDRGEAVAELMSGRWDVVLVDEFQDTDPVQWEIFRRGFADRDATLILVGDPKQAIYGFRGADVYAYLEAAAGAGSRPTLTTNFRSDQPLLDAYDAFFGNAQLGDAGIAYREVQAPDHHRGLGMEGAPSQASLRFRMLRRSSFSSLSRSGEILGDDSNPALDADVAADIAELLSSDARVRQALPTGGEGMVGVVPGHVAVLVRTNWQAARIRDALAELGVPAVINGAGSVFETDVASEWRRLLVALDRPSSKQNARGAALTSFFGWTPQQLAAADDTDFELIHRRLHRYARILRERGVAAMVEEMSATESIPARMLAREGGERDLTDLRHIAQLLHAEAVNEGRGLSALTAWLYRQVAEAGDDLSEERSRRLDSDEQAVQVLTIWRSKGLQFPFVYVPFLWTYPFEKGSPPITFHDESGKRRLDVSLGGDAYDRHAGVARDEGRGEDLRLAYVALTRAQHQAVVWWVPGWNAGRSTIGRLLFGRRSDGVIPVEGVRTPSDAEADERMAELEELSGGTIAAEEIVVGPGEPWEGSEPEAVELAAAEFDRGLDTLWRRNSYSSISAAAHEGTYGAGGGSGAGGSDSAWVASEPEGGPGLVDDEPEEDAEEDGEGLEGGGGAVGAGGVAVPGPGAAVLPSPWAELPGGRRVGTLVHSVMERVDFSEPELEAHLREVVDSQLAYFRMDLDRDALVAALQATIETPLGPLADGASLRSVMWDDRLDELTFELPLVGGDTPKGTLAVAAIGELLTEMLPAQDPVGAYARGLGEAELARAVRGYLTGSIDLVPRIFSPELSADRFYVVDYKTNFLGTPGEELTTWQYRPEALHAGMASGHYWLQALLYLVALHRYLRWRLPMYETAELNIGGVLYLFVRGMAGAETPAYDGGDGAPAGVVSWLPPEGVVEALSALLDEGSAS